MTKAQITRKRIDELLRFLPLFDTPGPNIELEWRGGDKDPKTGIVSFPYPIYPTEVEEFF
jgi:hypothetical protein